MSALTARHFMLKHRREDTTNVCNKPKNGKLLKKKTAKQPYMHLFYLIFFNLISVSRKNFVILRQI